MPATCSPKTLCVDKAHSSMDCYWRYVELESEPGPPVMTQAEWNATTRRHRHA